MAVFPYLDYEKMTAGERTTPTHDIDADDHALDATQVDDSGPDSTSNANAEAVDETQE